MSSVLRSFRYTIVRKLHDRKLPTVMDSFVNKNKVDGYVSYESPKKADYSKSDFKNFQEDMSSLKVCCGNQDVLCDDCPYERYD